VGISREAMGSVYASTTYAGPFLDHIWLIIVDAHSKWPVVITMKETTIETPLIGG